ncbi:hypothetical protein DMZ43_12050 [Meridianimaribacter sp. CL38]|uniref:restriction endonuclease subunit S n=1 Tax=Meridianimaribacter sp. CL38 TaxID=2213021 RepID=UPI00103927E3|nr:restriction endonuclease subunit S [Meridianimaribacter sp. CL38]TBV25662.1 hypothetical protein DMZ43_12050 [Meridianimaribacter sp. CL38]
MREGWKEVTIGDLGQVVTGKTPSTKEKKYFDGKYQFISPKDLGDDSRYINNTLTTITELAIEKFKNQVLPKNSIFFTSLSYGFGKMGIAKDICLTNQQIHSIVANPEVSDFNFVYYLLRYNTSLIRSHDAGIVTPIVPKSIFCKIKINLPPLNTQRKIASILSAYDDLIENNLKRIKLLEEQAQLTYEEWFVRFKFPGHETTKFDEETGLPEGWEKVKLNQIADFQNGYAFYTKGYSENGYTIIDLGNVSEYGDLNITGKEKFISEELYNELPKFHLNKYDIVIAMTDVTSALRILAKSAIIDKDNTYALNQRVGMLRPNTELFDYAFLYALLSDPRFIGRMKAMSKGAVQFYFNTKDIVNYETFLPSKDVIENFTKIYKPILELRMKLKDQNQHLKEARDILLPRLMSGMIDVDKLDVGSLTYEVNDSLGMVAEENKIYSK